MKLDILILTTLTLTLWKRKFEEIWGLRRCRTFACWPAVPEQWARTFPAPMLMQANLASGLGLDYCRLGTNEGMTELVLLRGEWATPAQGWDVFPVPEQAGGSLAKQWTPVLSVRRWKVPRSKEAFSHSMYCNHSGSWEGHDLGESWRHQPPVTVRRLTRLAHPGWSLCVYVCACTWCWGRDEPGVPWEWIGCLASQGECGIP